MENAHFDLRSLIRTRKEKCIQHKEKELIIRFYRELDTLAVTAYFLGIEYGRHSRNSNAAHRFNILRRYPLPYRIIRGMKIHAVVEIKNSSESI